jgi:hypothetical protein
MDGQVIKLEAPAVEEKKIMDLSPAHGLKGKFDDFGNKSTKTPTLGGIAAFGLSHETELEKQYFHALEVAASNPDA